MRFNINKMNKRINTFDKKYPPEYIKQQILQQILDSQNAAAAAALLITRQKNADRMILLIDPSVYGQDGTDYINIIRDDSPTSIFSIGIYNGANTLPAVFKQYYDLGYRCFVSPSINSYNLVVYCIPFFITYPDSICINTSSTQYFPNGYLPINIIRFSMDDLYMTGFIIFDLLYDISTALSNTGLDTLYKPLSVIPAPISGDRAPIFVKIVYIYCQTDSLGNPDTYALNFGTILQTNLALQSVITYEPFMITNNNFILPQRVLYLLSQNPVSGTNFKTSSKTIFILNSISPDKILSLFTDEYMYDNYFLFGDSFTSKHFTSKYRFNYALIPVANFSYDGYKICNNFSDPNYFSPFLYSISDVILKFMPYWRKFVALKYNTITMINELQKNNLIASNNAWSERKFFVYYVSTNPNNPTDPTNAFYNYFVISASNIGRTLWGSFKEVTDVQKTIKNDVFDPSSISLTEFGWNSRDSVVYNLVSDELSTIYFFNTNMLVDWYKNLNDSIGGNRNNLLIKGNKNHTPLFFEFWRSHDLRLKFKNVAKTYDLVMDYFIPQTYHINTTISISRKCFKTAGINDEIPADNFLYNENEEIILDFDTDIISPSSIPNYLIIKYFKGNRYQKSFNGLTVDYLSPLIIYFKINPIIVYTKYVIGDYVVFNSNNYTIGRIINVDEKFQDMTIQPYLVLNGIIGTEYYIIKNNDASHITLGQPDIKLYSQVFPLDLVDYTEWSIFTQNMFINSNNIDTLISNDTTNQPSITYEEFSPNSRPNVVREIKQNFTLFFSNISDYNLWITKVTNSYNNNDTHTAIFWETFRSNSLHPIQKTIDINLIMDNNIPTSYNIRELVQFNTNTYLDLDSIEHIETNISSIDINFNTPNIIPADISNNSFIYLKYFAGNEYQNNFTGCVESYFSPVLITINIIPTIIYNNYIVGDYVIYKDIINNTFTSDGQIAQVISVSNDNVWIEINNYDRLSQSTSSQIYIRANQYIQNSQQSDIVLYNTLSDATIFNLTELGPLSNNKIITSLNINSQIIEDNTNIESINISMFYTSYTTIVCPSITNFNMVFSNINNWNNWINYVNNEILAEKNHTPLFFEIWRSQNTQIIPINVTIDYKLVMNDSVSSIYNINQIVNIVRNEYSSMSSTSSLDTENYSFEMNFNTINILPQDISNNPIIYISYFNGNKYNNSFDGLTQTYYSPVVVTINIIPVTISDFFQISQYVISNQQIANIIDVQNNYQDITIQYYSMEYIDYNNNAIYIKKTSSTNQVDSTTILPYSNYYQMELYDQTEWGPFKYYNYIVSTVDLSYNTVEQIINFDNNSVGNINSQQFGLNSRATVVTAVKNNFNITFQNQSVFNKWTNLINSSVVVDNFNHTPLFFEIYRSHYYIISPLLISVNYNLTIDDTVPKSYNIIYNVSFTRNIYLTTNDADNNIAFTENDQITINFTTPLIISNNILNKPLVFVKYFKGHKYLSSFSNLNEPYYGPIVVYINIIPFSNITKVPLLPI